MTQSSTNGILWVGLDAHKKTIAVSTLLGGSLDEVKWEISNTEKMVRRLAKRLRKMAGDGEVRCVYEAGCLGFTLQRQLESSPCGIVCEVVAPSLIPRCPGKRVKTDSRDARELAIQNRAGGLTIVCPPSAGDEAVRDLCRCREDAVQDQMRARHRLSKFLLRRGYHWVDGSHWTLRHHAWLRSLQFDHPADQIVFLDYLNTVLTAEARVKDLTARVEEVSQTESYREVVGLLRCFRGIDTTTAMTVIAELFGFGRFRSPRELMSYLGLTPSEYSSGESTRRGSITKDGNSHVRRLLIQAAWCQNKPPTASRHMKKRQQGQPEWAVAIANRAAKRLHGRYVRLVGRKKHRNKAITAVAREFAGFIWCVLSEHDARKTG